MAILLDNFPKDLVARQLVAIEGIESTPLRSSERRWRVVLRSLYDNCETVHTVSSDYLLLLSLGSIWKEGKTIGFNQNLPKEESFGLDDRFPEILWRAENLNGIPQFLDRSVAGKDATSRFPAYQFINAHHFDGGYEILCISTSENYSVLCRTSAVLLSTYF